ncbi:MAG: glutamate 5-kinase [Phycisphaerae bacterium]|nr:glutamate 5-kinase [Phycisphaerae bacterium]
MPSTMLRQQLMKNVHNLVVKVGTNLLTDTAGRLDKVMINAIGRQLGLLSERGIHVTLITSGAVGSGMGIAGLTSRPRELPVLQASAAIGQPTLMALYARALSRFGMHAGQLLVTRDDFEHRSRYLNIRNTVGALHRLRAVPIINENDTTAVVELGRFADNDTIAALVANLIKADLLVLLTVADGLLNTEGQRIDLVPRVTPEVLKLARAEKSALGSGGMGSKLRAVSMVTEAGETVVIAHGRERNVLLRLLEGERLGTIFAPAEHKMSARQRWLRSAVRPVGRLMLDDGAADAVLRKNKSLLPRGITAVTGRFERGAVVALVNPAGQTIAHGVVNYGNADLDRIKGLKSAEIAAALGAKPFDEAVHRDHLVVIAGQ